MINYVLTEVFESPAKVLVNTVNTVGVMGKGIAKEFKYFYPEMFKEYQCLCEQNQFQVGQLWLYKTPNKWILNFPTKISWRQPSRPEYIEMGLKKFVESYAENGIFSIAFPMLGCGNGALSWDKVVRPMMEKYLKNLPIEIFIHIKGNNPFIPEHYDQASMKSWLRNEPQSLGFIEVWNDICEIINKQKHYKTFNNANFSVELLNENEGLIEIISENEKTLLHKESFVDLWQSIRTLGFCLDRTMPSGLDCYSDYVIALLANLNYLEPIVVTVSNKKIIGLRLRLPTRKFGNPQLSLIGSST